MSIAIERGWKADAPTPKGMAESESETEDVAEPTRCERARERGERLLWVFLRRMQLEPCEICRDVIEIMLGLFLLYLILIQWPK
tara:strand:- start:794 stop:1045 length:252 start_codon:yes stop_codon:yes gene_type:complete